MRGSRLESWGTRSPSQGLSTTAHHHYGSLWESTYRDHGLPRVALECQRQAEPRHVLLPSGFVR